MKSGARVGRDATERTRVILRVEQESERTLHAFFHRRIIEQVRIFPEWDMVNDEALLLCEGREVRP